MVRKTSGHAQHALLTTYFFWHALAKQPVRRLAHCVQKQLTTDDRLKEELMQGQKGKFCTQAMFSLQQRIFGLKLEQMLSLDDL